VAAIRANPVALRNSFRHRWRLHSVGSTWGTNLGARGSNFLRVPEFLRIPCDSHGTHAVICRALGYGSRRSLPIERSGQTGHNAPTPASQNEINPSTPTAQMAAYSAIVPPASLGEALRPLEELSEVEFSALTTAVAGPRSFSLSKDDLGTLRNQLGTHAANLTFLLAALAFLYSHVERLVESGMPYAEAIRATTDELASDAQWGPKKGEVQNRLALILKNKDVHQRFRKIQRLQAGFIPNAIGFSTFVDLRPDFGDGEELNLKGYLPIVQFRVTTDSNSPETRRLVFQMSEDALAEKTVERAEKKLALLKEQPAIALQFVKI
jgi:hypothetical protein